MNQHVRFDEAAARDAYLSSTTASPTWGYERMSRRANDVNKLDELFDLDDAVATTLREIIQNIIDAKARTLRLHFGKRTLDQLEAIAFSEIMERAAGCHTPSDRRPLAADVSPEGTVRCLEIADDGKGLGGPFLCAPRFDEIPGGFQGFANGFGNSSKVDDNSAGSKGVGRSQIAFASTINTIAAFTRRADDGQHLFFALSLLRFHRYRGAEYRGTGQFLIDNEHLEDPSVPPQVGDAALASADLLGMTRDRATNGLSLLVPSIKDEFNVVSFMTDILKNHMVSILLGSLEITVSDDDVVHVVNRETIFEHAANPLFGGSAGMAERIRSISTLLEAVLKGGVALGKITERFSRTTVPDETLIRLSDELEAGRPAVVNVEMQARDRKGAAGGVMTFGVIENPLISEGLHINIRDGLPTISGGPTGQQVPAGHIVIVRSAGDAVARLLRDAEDAAHTNWTAGKAAHTWPLKKAECIVPSFKFGGMALLQAITKREDDKESNGFTSLFGMPDEVGRKIRRPADDNGEGKRDPSEEAGDPQEANPGMFEMELVPPNAGQEWGFRIVLSEAGRGRVAKGPVRVRVQAAYSVSRGSPKYDNHSKADFDFMKFDFGFNRELGGDHHLYGLNGFDVTVSDPEFWLTGMGPFNHARGVDIRYSEIAA